MTEVLKGKTVAQAQHLFDAFHTLCTTADLDPDVPDGDADPLERLQVFSGVRAFDPREVRYPGMAHDEAALAGRPRATSE